MLVTREEAKRMVCVQGPGGCIADSCMAWRWSDIERFNADDSFEYGVGYCGLAGGLRNLRAGGLRNPNVPIPRKSAPPTRSLVSHTGGLLSSAPTRLTG